MHPRRPAATFWYLDILSDVTGGGVLGEMRDAVSRWDQVFTMGRTEGSSARRRRRRYHSGCATEARFVFFSYLASGSLASHTLLSCRLHTRSSGAVHMINHPTDLIGVVSEALTLFLLAFCLIRSTMIVTSF